MFSELNNCFNSFKGNLFQACLVISYFVGRFIRILFKVKNFGIIGAVAVLSPCFVNICPIFGGQMVSENLKSFQVAMNVSEPQKFTKVVTTSEVPDVSIVFQKSDFGKKSISKISSGFIKLLPRQKISSVFVGFLNQLHASFISEACAQGSSAKTCEDGSNGTNNSDRSSRHNTISFQWVVGYIALLIILMIFSWGIGLWVFYIFTQHIVDCRIVVL